jgi:hypothetical protein
MHNFCTLFNSNYLTRGLALYQSLERVCSSFHLFVVAFDDMAFNYLTSESLSNLTVISLKDFEDKDLLKVKPTRTAAEYCWTSTSSLILHCLEKYNLDSCTYVDADMIFFQDPAALIAEAAPNSVIITEHRYTPEYDVSATHGIYCVQFMYFRSDSKGLKVLKWWRERCLEWCFDRQEDGKFGDQKYLDNWTTQFEGVFVLQNPGAGVAPWNIQQYQIREKNDDIVVYHNKTRTESLLYFYHYHGLKFYTDQFATCTGTLYKITEAQKKLVYYPYIALLQNIEERIRQKGLAINVNGARSIAPTPLQLFTSFIKEHIIVSLKGNFRILKQGSLNFKQHCHLVNTNLIKHYRWPKF